MRTQHLHRYMRGWLPAAASVAVGLAITETWRFYSWQTLAWAWIAAPAVLAGFLTRLWPRLRQAYINYSAVSQTAVLLAPQAAAEPSTHAGLAF